MQKLEMQLCIFALKRKIDYLLFWDDDEYPYANIRGEKNGSIIWKKKKNKTIY